MKHSGRHTWRGLRLSLLSAAFAMAAGAASADDLDDLFDLDAPISDEAVTDSMLLDDLADGTPTARGIRLGGYGEFAAAYTDNNPSRWSRLRTRLELNASGRLGAGLRFHVGVRADHDAAYDFESRHYPRAVRRDQRSELSLREAYVDFGAGEWEFRLGRQHVVWGEMVGLFLADVVSARDMREFVLPEFDAMRIPQWAARAEYFAGETHFELLWIPYASYDKVGKPGSNFYPFGLPAGTPVRDVTPSRKLSNSNWGLRVSRLIAGWDLSAFHYQSRDTSPTLYGIPAAPFELRHDRLRQTGATFSKDMRTFVLKGEAVHTSGRRFAAPTPFVMESASTLDYVLGADFTQGDWRLNAQVFGRRTLDYDSRFNFDRNELGYTLLLNRRLNDRVEAELLYASSFNRSDYMLRPKLIWNVTQDWRAMMGADVFGGRKNAMFGRFGDQDRVYLELRRWF